jgi:hypothetical protein
VHSSSLFCDSIASSILTRQVELQKVIGSKFKKFPVSLAFRFCLTSPGLLSKKFNNPPPSRKVQRYRRYRHTPTPQLQHHDVLQDTSFFQSPVCGSRVCRRGGIGASRSSNWHGGPPGSCHEPSPSRSTYAGSSGEGHSGVVLNAQCVTASFVNMWLSIVEYRILK